MQIPCPFRSKGVIIPRRRRARNRVHWPGGEMPPAKKLEILQFPHQTNQKMSRKVEVRTHPMAGDQQLTCSDCGQEFTFTSEDQAFFLERGYSAPKRCKPCRQAKKAEQSGGGYGGGYSGGGGYGGGGYQRSQSTGTPVICSGCGQQTTVPFEPRGDRPVYCRDCYQAQKGGSGGGGGASRGRGRY